MKLFIWFYSIFQAEELGTCIQNNDKMWFIVF